MTQTPAIYTPITPSTHVGGFGIEGLEDMGQRDMVVPRKSIVQLTSKHSEEYGGFYDNLTKQAVKSINAVVLKITHTRTLWSGDPNDEKPECTSRDNVTGTQHGACADCQFNTDNNSDLWDKGMKRCSLGYNLLCINSEDDSLFVFQALKTSAKPVKALITQYVNRRKSPFAFITKFMNEKVTVDGNTYYVFKPMITKQLDATEYQVYREIYLSMKGATIREVEDRPDELVINESPPTDGQMPF